MMEKDTKDCHAFVVCSKTVIGDDSCPVHAEVRLYPRMHATWRHPLPWAPRRSPLGHAQVSAPE